MHKSSPRLVPLLVAGLTLVGGTRMDAATAYAVTSAGNLITFNTATPGTTSGTVGITGLQPGEQVLGLDFRPVNGTLYALGSTSRLYVLNRTTGAATQVGSAGAFTLSGASFAFDFNPMVDRIRVVSDTDQSLRLNPNDGTLTAADTAINPAGFTLTGAAYTSNFGNAPSTTLYGIDVEGDRLVSFAMPNNGTVSAVGPLGVSALAVTGFDIETTAGGNVAWAALTVNGTSSGLYSINLATGAATLVGAIGVAQPVIVALAIEPLPSVTFFAPLYSGIEAGPPLVTINRIGSTEGTVTVQFTMSGGTATTPADYADASQTVTFGPGVTSQPLLITLVNDTIFEGDETVNLSLSSPTGAVLGTTTSAVLTIVDNDTQPRISIDDVLVNEPAGTATFTVSLSNPSAFTVTVSAVTADGSATAGVDYTATGPITLTFAPLDTTETFTVPILNDVFFEGSETFAVNLSGAVNATIADAQGVGVISSDDAAPQVPALSLPMLAGFALLLAAAGAALLTPRLPL